MHPVQVSPEMQELFKNVSRPTMKALQLHRNKNPRGVVVTIENDNNFPRITYSLILRPNFPSKLQTHEAFFGLTTSGFGTGNFSVQSFMIEGDEAHIIPLEGNPAYRAFIEDWRALQPDAMQS